MSDMRRVRFDCPFDGRLARTPYLVLPKLALQAMPFEWRDRFEAMLAEMDATGMETPSYHVFRDDGEGGEYTRARVVNERTGYVRICGGKDDPWADYRHGSVEDICPGFVRPADPQSYRDALTERTRTSQRKGLEASCRTSGSQDITG